MFVHIVVLYMVYMFNLPEWCKWLIWIAIVLKAMGFLLDIYKAGTRAEHEK